MLQHSFIRQWSTHSHRLLYFRTVGAAHSLLDCSMLLQSSISHKSFWTASLWACGIRCGGNYRFAVPVQIQRSSKVVRPGWLCRALAYLWGSSSTSCVAHRYWADGQLTVGSLVHHSPSVPPPSPGISCDVAGSCHCWLVPLLQIVDVDDQWTCFLCHQSHPHNIYLVQRSCVIVVLVQS